MAFTNSSLVSYTKISPNKTVGRNHEIDCITIHCVVGQCSVQTLGAIFAPTSRQASSNYGIGYDGKIGMYCEEKDRSWCTSSASNDHRAVTIEVASDTTHPYAVNDKAYAALIDLVTDICKRNGIKKLVWSTNKNDRVNHLNGCNMTVHRDYANKSCPGEYLYSRHAQIAEEVNKRLGATTVTKPATSTSTSTLKFNKGDIVQFAGGKHYASANAANGSTVKASKAKITSVSAKGKHPYHLRAVNDAGSFIGGVYGWVDASTVSAITTTSATTATTTKPSTTTTATSKIVKGTVVSIAKGAKYYSGTTVPSWVIAKNWVVKENPNGDRVVIDKSADGKNSICSAISSKYLTIVSGGSTSTATTTTTAKPATTTTTATIKKGSKVKVKSGAKTYTGGSLASFVYKTTYTVLEEPKGDRVVIGLNGQVTAAVNKKDLTLA